VSSAPLVSVIIPAFNAAHYIDATLASILSQSYAPIEVLVVDDGSTDGTAARVRAYGSRVRYFHQPNSGGCSKPRNAAIAEARGEWLSFFDADDLMLPGRVASHAAFLRRHAEAGIVFSNYRRFTADGTAGPDHFSGCPRLLALFDRAGDRAQADGMLLTSRTATGLLLSENFGSALITVRREVFETVGLYDETLGASEDFELQFRITERYAAGVLPQVDWHRRMHAASMTANTENILRWKIRTRERILEREQDAGRRQLLRETLAGFHSALAYYYSSRQTSEAIAHACHSTRLAARPRVRIFARIAVDAVRQRVAVLSASAATKDGVRRCI
jgi:glycosyltransferase involved in cell wall biosynthesis